MAQNDFFSKLSKKNITLIIILKKKTVRLLLFFMIFFIDFGRKLAKFGRHPFLHPMATPPISRTYPGKTS